LFVRVVLVAIVAGVMLAFALPAFAQDVGGQEVCDWYWEDYEFNTSGGLEYWCGDPQFTAAALDEPAVSEERPVANEEPLVVEQAPQPIVVESEGVSDAPVAEEAVSEEAVSEEAVSEEAVSEEAVSAAPTRDQTDEQAENAPERRLLVLGIIALTLIIAALMAWRLPMRSNVEDPAAWGNENYAPPEAPTEASPEAAKVPEGEPSSPASGAPPEEATPEPSVSSSGISNSPAREAEDAVVPVGGAAAAASARAQEERLNQERLRRIRHLRRIRQGRSPSSW
jgi:hypothetical protein